ncbi:MAG: pyruvate ferredoxin oxidoreductase, partial [Oscillospiraceae bacterium]|nr:pyruvate ferredoxin oxidoreductase [Oscillospiraceae bacterium]
EIFGRKYSGLINTYLTDDADYVLITLGTVGGLCREVADELRSHGIKAGVITIRYMRPFPAEELAQALKNVKAAAVLEKDISFGSTGTVYADVVSALHRGGLTLPVYNFIGGLGGADITRENIAYIFKKTEQGTGFVNFIGIEV